MLLKNVSDTSWTAKPIIDLSALEFPVFERFWKGKKSEEKSPKHEKSIFEFRILSLCGKLFSTFQFSENFLTKQIDCIKKETLF